MAADRRCRGHRCATRVSGGGGCAAAVAGDKLSWTVQEARRKSTAADNYTGEEIMAAGEQRWRELANRIAGEKGFDLEDFAVVSAGRRRLVKVVIDSDTGVALDDAAEVSRRLSEEFDADEAAGPDAAGAVGALPYTLEVTSPGVGRPLTQPRHFRRAGTRLITATTVDGRTVTGRVVGITDGGVDLLTGKSGIEPLTLPFDEIAKARVEVDFSGPSAAVRAALAADPRSSALLSDGTDNDGTDDDFGDDDDDGDFGDDDSADDESTDDDGADRAAAIELDAEGGLDDEER
ncbi:ribosome maturation factor RimP [Nakamurella lactea]|uniref:ribosome maturation factor RimP n=1 Tax=Nakamurella lactea TaxID=459515 RepID=UPI001B7FA9C5|nr:ribosome maturation factor RimP [Nakamurella lactea]